MSNEQSQRSSKRVLSEEAEALQEAFPGLFSVGRLWVQHGLRVAELALQTSAETLRVTAEVLRQGSSRLDTPTDAE
jgi:chaperonin cofactor prefoldin